MRGWLPAAFILGMTVALGAQQPTFRSTAQIVPLYITVTDSAGRLVPNLTKEDFTVLDNGVPQEIAVFDNTVRPITSVVMLDTSGSMTLNLDLMKAAGRAVHHPPPARGQGDGRRLQQQDRVRQHRLHQRS
jgi:hypothetical protein